MGIIFGQQQINTSVVVLSCLLTIGALLCLFYLLHIAVKNSRELQSNVSEYTKRSTSSLRSGFFEVLCFKYLDDQETYRVSVIDKTNSLIHLEYDGYLKVNDNISHPRIEVEYELDEDGTEDFEDVLSFECPRDFLKHL